MARGGCFCGNIRIEYVGQPIASGLCHCNDCRKLTGALYSYSIIINRADLKITGTPKPVAKTADSGNRITNYFCSDCGTPIYGHGIDTSGEPASVAILRAGLFDNPELLDQRKPVVEIYTRSRVSWLSPIEGAEQFPGMLPML
ncbi:Mss4-like protein [Aspergillus aurantiobrunneus]